jgi:hypothetical protein
MVAQSNSQVGAQQRTVHTPPEKAGAPLRVARIIAGNAELVPNVPFQADDQWLNSLSVVLRNTTRRTKIVEVALRLSFADPYVAQVAPPTYDIHIGQMPEHALYNRSGSRFSQQSTEILDLSPGQELTIPLSRFMPKIQAALQAGVATDVRNCVVRVGIIYFEDGTRWYPDTFERPDPAVPGKYIPMTRDELRALAHKELDNARRP